MQIGISLGIGKARKAVAVVVGTWILAANVWNDAGQWDDANTWKD